MKILVTGATGNVGYNVVLNLLAKDEKVVAAVTNIDEAKKKFGNKVEYVLFDFTNPSTFNNALKDVDRVFLMRPPHLGKPKDLYPFIDSVKKHQIKLVSFLSLMGVENNPIPPHHKIEKYIEQLELPYAHIRPGFFMQNVSGIHANEIRDLNEIFIPAGNSKTSFIDAADIGLAIATVLYEPNKYKNNAYTITGSEALDYYEIADILSKILKRQIKYTKPGFLKYRTYYIKQRKLAKNYVNVTVALYFMTRMGTAKAITNTFYELTGQKPKLFVDFVKENANQFVK